MRKLGLWSALYKGLAAAHYLFALGIATISASLKADSAALVNTGWQFLKPSLDYIQHGAWFAIPLLTVHQKGIVSPDHYDIAKGIVSDVGDKLLERVA